MYRRKFPKNHLACTQHSCYILSDSGNLYSWGQNGRNCLLQKDLTKGDKKYPLGRATAVAAPVDNIFAHGGGTFFYLSQGKLWSVGRNDFGQAIGTSTTNRDNQQVLPFFNDKNVQYVVNMWSTFVHCSPGGEDCVYRFGYNYYSNLGLPPNIKPKDNASCLQFVKLDIKNVTTVKKIGVGEQHTLFLTNDGVYVCGTNASGARGGASVSKITKMKYFVKKKIHVVDLSAGYCHSVFVGSNGKVYGCGMNSSGELGLGKKLRDVHTVTHLEKIKDSISKVQCGYQSTFCLNFRGELWFMGMDIENKLPVKIKSSLRFLEYRASQNYLLLLASNGEVFGHEMDYGYKPTKYNKSGSFEEGDLKIGTSMVIKKLKFPERMITSGREWFFEKLRSNTKYLDVKIAVF